MSEKWTGFLKFMAWLNVIISFVAMVSFLCLLGRTSANGTNWYIVSLGIGLMLESLFVLGFVMVICLIAEKASDVTNYLEKLSRHFISSEKPQETDEWECPKCGRNNPNDLYVCNNCNYRIG